MPEEQNTQSNDSGKQREKIALWVTRLAIGGTIAIALGAIAVAYVEGTKGEIFKYTVGALLPLWGTWMGTILAYYFSKENVDAANRTVQYLTGKIVSPTEKLQSIKSKDVMMMIKDIKTYILEDETSLEKTKIKDLIDFMEEKKIEGQPLSRLPIVTKENVLIYIIHRSVFDGFITDQLKDKLNADKNSNEVYEGLTIGNLKNNGSENVKTILSNGAVFVDENSTLRDAQILLEKITVCKDVFITQNGKPEEKIIGWITDDLISKKANTE